MELCSDRHQKVCFEGKNCPVCESLDRQAEDAEFIRELEGEIKGLKEEAGS